MGYVYEKKLEDLLSSKFLYFLNTVLGVAFSWIVNNADGFCGREQFPNEIQIGFVVDDIGDACHVRRRFVHSDIARICYRAEYNRLSRECLMEDSLGNRCRNRNDHVGMFF